jgi:hypothetical protein
LLEIIGAGKLQVCAEIAHNVAMDSVRTVRERSLAIDALLQLNDPRLNALATSLETDIVRWPDAMARHAAIDLFPTYMPVPRLLQIPEFQAAARDQSHGPFYGRRCSCSTGMGQIIGNF